MSLKAAAETDLPAGGIGPGVFVAVAGPSGAGKDTLINYARTRLDGRGDIVFVRRIITRQPDRMTEDHDTLEPEAFAAAVCEGRFAIMWEAHGLQYGLPVSIDADIAAGKVVVANISRGIIDDLAERYANMALVVVSAHAHVIAARLAARGRENDVAIAARLERRSTEDLVRFGAIRLENSGPVEVAGERFTGVLVAAANSVAAGETKS
jgi:ribose 1,5-bisphosphokinase